MWCWRHANWFNFPCLILKQLLIIHAFHHEHKHCCHQDTAICRGAAFQPFLTFRLNWQFQLPAVERIPSMADPPTSAGIVLIQLSANEDESSTGIDRWWSLCRKTVAGERTHMAAARSPPCFRINTHTHVRAHHAAWLRDLFFLVSLDLAAHHGCAFNCNSDPRPVYPTCVFRTLGVSFPPFLVLAASQEE